jgi:hypothetical protein
MYPHLYVRADVPSRMGQPFACRCGHYGFAEGERGSRCRAAMEERIAELEARCDAAIKRADELEERMTTADAPWRVPGCQCPADSKPGDRCDARWSRCNGRLQWLKAFKAKEVS